MNKISQMVSSILLKIALTTGICIFVIITVLITSNVILSRNTHDYVTGQVMGFTDGQIKESLLNRASSEAGEIKTELDVGLYAARTMAKTFAVLAGRQ
jgi:methyl-accepting chemotaxis protein